MNNDRWTFTIDEFLSEIGKTVFLKYFENINVRQFVKRIDYKF